MVILFRPLRLARFNVRSAAGIKGDYAGFPTTLMAGLLYTFMLSLAARPAFFAGVAAPWLPLIFVFCAAGMVVPLRVPRFGAPRIRILLPVVLGVVATGVVLVALRILPEYGLACSLFWVVTAFVHHLRWRPT